MSTSREQSTGLMLIFGACVIAGSFLISGCNQGGGDGMARAQGSPLDKQILDKLTAIEQKLQTQDLSGVHQNWNKVLPAAQRFVLLAAFNNEAVLDKETGLVWQQSPTSFASSWDTALFHCASIGTGGRLGWRLPSFSELSSLQVPHTSSQTAGPLPEGHPFTNVLSAFYWTATKSSRPADDAWVANFLATGGGMTTDSQSSSNQIWCVRGYGPLPKY